MWSTVAREDMSKRVYIVDDGDAVRSALSLLIRAYGWEAQAHASAESFLEDDVVAEESCLLLDLDMPGMNGAELCEHLKGARSAIPVLVVTAHQDDPLANLNWTTEDFAWITRELCKVAEETCGGRIVSSLEGGYDLDALAESVAAHVTELMEA